MLKGMAAQTWKALPMCILTIYLFTSISAFYFPPAMVKVGTLISLNTDHGKQIKSALEYAIEKVNEDSRLLRGTALKIIMAEVNCSVLQSTFSAMQLLEDGVLALIGPQSSGESYFVAQMAEAVQVPLISFSATDPSLSQSQYSYFLRLVPSEKAHMSAIAAIIRHYGWNNVVALFYDDDFGWNTVMYLEESLNEVGVMIVRKAALGFATTDEIIYKVLADLRHMRSMVFVAYVSPQIGRMLLSVAMKLRMFNTDYAWIVNEDVFNILHETNVGDNYTAVTESAITTRPYIPLSSELTDFLTGFREKLRNSQIIDPSVSKDALYAHDALWVFAKALDRFMHQKKYFLEKSNVSESYNQQESQMFNEGPELLYHILRSKFTGVTGHIEFDSKGDRRNSVVEVVRGVGKYLEVIGYWSTTYGNLTLHPPSATSVSMLNVTKVDKVTGHVKHLSRNSKIPVDHKADRYLRIIIPRKSGFRYFVNVTVDKHNNTLVTGFCIDIFKAALRYLPYNLSYSFTPYGNGVNNPNYDEIIERVANKSRSLTQLLVI